MPPIAPPRPPNSPPLPARRVRHWPEGSGRRRRSRRPGTAAARQAEGAGHFADHGDDDRLDQRLAGHPGQQLDELRLDRARKIAEAGFALGQQIFEEALEAAGDAVDDFAPAFGFLARRDDAFDFLLLLIGDAGRA
jgi:hypothetical protein